MASEACSKTLFDCFDQHPLSRVGIKQAVASFADDDDLFVYDNRWLRRTLKNSVSSVLRMAQIPEKEYLFRQMHDSPAEKIKPFSFLSFP